MGTTPWGDNGVVAVHDFFHSGRVLRAHGDQCRMAGRSVVEWSHADKSGSGLPWKQQEMAVGLSAGFFFFFFFWPFPVLLIFSFTNPSLEHSAYLFATLEWRCTHPRDVLPAPGVTLFLVFKSGGVYTKPASDICS